LFGAHLSTGQARQIIHHAAEGVGVWATARLLGLTKNTVNLAIVKVGEHRQKVFGALMRDLQMNEVQLDELWTFVKKTRPKARGNSGGAKEKLGSGRP
jgi:hypothetical protein